MSKRRVVAYSVVAAGLLLWAGLGRDTFPLVALAAGALVTALVHLGPSDTKQDPRDADDAAVQIARRRRHAEGSYF